MARMNNKAQTMTLRVSGELTLDCESLLALLRSESSEALPAQNPVPAQKGTTRLAYSVHETGELLGISYGSVYRLIRRGVLKSSGALRHKLIARSEIERFLKETMVREY
jgi:excisionase family DNA binding protein